MSMSYHFYNLFLCSTVSDIEDEEGNAVLEEQEALKLQKQMAEQLDDQDFGLDMFQVQGSHRLEKYLKMKGCLEKSLKTKFVLKST